MQNTIRLIITDAEIVEAGLLIKSMSVIDTVSGETLKIAKLTPELLDFLKMIEIDCTNFLHIQEMKKKNPNLTKLIDTFKLFT